MNLHAILSCAVWALLPATTSAEAVRFALEPSSDFQDGCQDGCACPITVSSLEGTFVLISLGHQDDFELFDVTDVAWIIGNDGPGALVSGSGTFRIRAGADPAQRLELDLSIGGGEPIRFDSGLVPVAATWPGIEVAIAMNGFFCYDNVFSVNARPGISISVEPTSWGGVKGRYQP